MRWIFASFLAAVGCSAGSPAATDAAISALDGGPARDAGHIGAPDAWTPSDAGADSSALIDAGADAASRDAGALDGGDAGPPCTLPSDCASGSFCMFATGVCAGAGVCATTGGACPLTFQPVCACNGRTYVNRACAQAAGLSLLDDTLGCGPALCGCTSDASCSPHTECVGTTGGGACEPILPLPMCWRDEDCGAGQTCDGESVCPCGAHCTVADRPGSCR